MSMKGDEGLLVHSNDLIYFPQHDEIASAQDMSLLPRNRLEATKFYSTT